MTLRCSKTLSALLGVGFGLSIVTTAFARGDDDSSSNDDASARRSSDKDNSEGARDPDRDGDEGKAAPRKKLRKKKRAAVVQVETEADTAKGSLALLGSFGPSSDYTRGGVGLRGGLTLDGSVPFYFGGIGTYFFGNEQTTNGQLGGEGSSVTKWFMYLGGETGLDLEVITDIRMRPYLGLGFGRSSSEECSSSGDCASTAKYPLTFTPGVVGLYNLGASLFIGADVRFLIAAGHSTVSGPVLSATLGFEF